MSAPATNWSGLVVAPLRVTLVDDGIDAVLVSHRYTDGFFVDPIATLAKDLLRAPADPVLPEKLRGHRRTSPAPRSITKCPNRCAAMLKAQRLRYPGHGGRYGGQSANNGSNRFSRGSRFRG